MLVIVAYDIATTDEDGQRRLRETFKICRQYGQHVQNSLFECLVEPHEFIMLRQSLLAIVDLSVDALRFYHLGKNWKQRVEKYGAKLGYDPEAALVI